MQKIVWTVNVKKDDVLQRGNEKSNILHTKRRQAIWIGHILRRHCLLKQVIEGKMKGKGRRGRRCKQLLGGLKEKRGYWKLKEEALGRTLWRTRCGRGYGLIRRQAAELMTESVPRPSPPQSTFLQTQIFTPSSPCPVPLVSGWLMADHPVDVSSQLETVKMDCQKYLLVAG
jgi:hypothetical protein